MTSAEIAKDDSKQLAALAFALAEKPRSSLQELAKAVGVSKATLYRFCNTREELVERLLKHGIAVTSEIIRSAKLNELPPLEGLRLMTQNSLENREITAFLMYHWTPDSESGKAVEAEWDAALDAFFLRGQQEGVFRIDIPAPALTEIWVALLLGLVDAERRGRVARAALPDLLEVMFLQGVGKQ